MLRLGLMGVALRSIHADKLWPLGALGVDVRLALMTCCRTSRGDPSGHLIGVATGLLRGTCTIREPVPPFVPIGCLTCLLYR